MRLYKNNDLKIILKVVSVNLNIPYDVVEAVFSQYYKDVKEIVDQQKRSEILDFPTILLHSFGKLYISENKKKKIDKLLKEYQEKKNEQN